MQILLELFLSFFQTGLFTFGGGYAMVPLIQQEIVDVHSWMTALEVADIVGISQITPGPFAVNAATVVGMKMAGFPGAVAATLGVVMPSIIIVLIVSRFFFQFNKTKSVQGVLWGIRPVVVALLVVATYSMVVPAFLPGGFTAPGHLLYEIDWLSVAMFALVMFLIIKFKKISPILWIFASAALGVFIFR